MARYNLTTEQQIAIRNMVGAALRGPNEFLHVAFAQVGERALFGAQNSSDGIPVREPDLIHFQQLGLISLSRRQGFFHGSVLQRAIDAVEANFEEPPQPAAIENVANLIIGGMHGGSVQALMGSHHSIHQMAPSGNSTEDVSRILRELVLALRDVLPSHHADALNSDAVEIERELRGRADRLTMLKAAKTMGRHLMGAIDMATDATDRVDKIVVAGAKWAGWLLVLSQLAK